MKALDQVIDGVHCVKDAIPRQWAQVMITTESGCDPMKGEYGMEVVGIVGSWRINDNFDGGDFHILQESIVNNFDFSLLPKEGHALLMLEEDGEWDGFPQWNKYFTIKTTEIVEY